MAVIVSVAASSSEVVAGSQIQWTVLIVNTDTQAAVVGAVAFAAPAGTTGRSGRGGGHSALGVTAVDTLNWVGDGGVTIPAGGSVWYIVTDTVLPNAIGTVQVTASFTPQNGQAVTSTASVTSSVAVEPTFVPTTSVSAGFCEPIFARVCTGGFVALPAGQESVLWMEVYTGEREMRGARLVMWWNPLQFDPPDASQTDYDRWLKQGSGVLDLRIPWLPASSTLTIDGRTEDMTLKCGQTVVPAEPYVLTETTSFCWPVLTCYDAVFAFIADEYNTDLDKARVTVETYPRYRL